MDKKATANLGLNVLFNGIVVPLLLNMLSVPPLIIIGFAVASMVMIWLWGHSPHELGWRRRMWPTLVMLTGSVIFLGGAVWFYRQNPRPVPAPEAGAANQPKATENSGSSAPVQDAQVPAPSPKHVMAAASPHILATAPIVPSKSIPMSRTEIVKTLRGFSVEVAHLADIAARCQNEAEVAVADKQLSAADNRIAGWIHANMGGDFAALKYRTPGLLRISPVPWHGASNDDSGFERRNQLMSSMLARQANLQDMIAAPTWDKQ